MKIYVNTCYTSAIIYKLIYSLKRNRNGYLKSDLTDNKINLGITNKSISKQFLYKLVQGAWDQLYYKISNNGQAGIANKQILI